MVAVERIPGEKGGAAPHRSEKRTYIVIAGRPRAVEKE
jgi:hypothetical protein